MSFTLPPLPYDYEALAPVMSSQTLHLHHEKHHQTYITNLENLLKENTAYQGKSLEEIVKASAKDASAAGVFNNAGQHWNHILFWQCMKKSGGGNIPPELEKMINESFGSVDAFKDEFTKAGLTQFGSGWAWLVLEDDGKLAVMKTPNADNPLAHGKHALLGCDVWEHSYYLDYQNRRPDYLKAFLGELINWEFVASRLSKEALAV
jgi:Fe-Mn family superoxide dismutase